MGLIQMEKHLLPVLVQRPDNLPRRSKWRATPEDLGRPSSSRRVGIFEPPFHDAANPMTLNERELPLSNEVEVESSPQAEGNGRFGGCFPQCFKAYH